MLNSTVTPDPRTLAAPFTAQNQGVGRGSISPASLMPVGNMNPIITPVGMIPSRQTVERTNSELPSKFCMRKGSQSGKANR